MQALLLLDGKACQLRTRTQLGNIPSSDANNAIPYFNTFTSSSSLASRLSRKGISILHLWGCGRTDNEQNRLHGRVWYPPATSVIVGGIAGAGGYLTAPSNSGRNWGRAISSWHREWTLLWWKCWLKIYMWHFSLFIYETSRYYSRSIPFFFLSLFWGVLKMRCMQYSRDKTSLSLLPRSLIFGKSCFPTNAEYALSKSQFDIDFPIGPRDILLCRP